MLRRNIPITYGQIAINSHCTPNCYMDESKAMRAATSTLTEVARVVRPMFGPLGVDAVVVDPTSALATNRRVRFAVWNFVN